MEWKQYIVSDKDILKGNPTIKGTRISVELILELLASGWGEQTILESYPTLKKEHMRAVYAYLKECIEQELFFRVEKPV